MGRVSWSRDACIVSARKKIQKVSVLHTVPSSFVLSSFQALHLWMASLILRVDFFSLTQYFLETSSQAHPGVHVTNLLSIPQFPQVESQEEPM